MTRKTKKIIGLSLLLVYLAVAGSLWRPSNTPKVYKDVMVVLCDSDSTRFVEADEIKESLRQWSMNPVGKTVAEYSTYKLQKQLLGNTLIKNAYCYPTPDSLLRIDIYQRHPILRVKSDSLLADAYVDTEGCLMQFKYCKNAVDVPLATGHIDSLMAQGDLYVLAKYLKANEFWKNAITQIYVEPNKDIRLIPRVGNHTILLGSVENLEAKFDKLLLFYQKVLNRTGWNAYATINLKFNNQVVAEKQTKKNKKQKE